jgi:hypothetical protein
MGHDIAKLQEKVRRLEHSAAAFQELCTVLPPIMHRPGWTTVIEVAFVDAALTSMQSQVESVTAQFRRLTEIAQRIGTAVSVPVES